MFKFNYEYEFVDYLIDHFVQYFNCEFMGREIRIEQMKVDIVGETDNAVFLIEVKRDCINTDTIKQIIKYVDNYKSDKNVVGIAVAPKIDPKCYGISIPNNIILKALDDVKYEAPREHYGVTVDKEILKRFKELAEKTRIPQSKLMDEAIEDLLKKYSDKVEGQ